MMKEFVMTDLEQEQQAQLMAREIVQMAEQVQREAIDVIPRTLFGSGVVFLSIVVPLYFTNRDLGENVRLCFLLSVVLMFVALLNGGVLLLRSNRVAKNVIDHMLPIAYGRSLWFECEVSFFRWWEILEFVLMCLAFVGSITMLLVAMFLK